jgi:sialate O-acetylesterase
MVLKHNEPFVIWGVSTNKGEVVQVSFLSKTYNATASASDGKWVATLPAQPTTLTPATISIASASDKIELTDILFGEVHVCSGQSNSKLLGRPLVSTFTQGAVSTELLQSVCSGAAGRRNR